MLSVEYYGIRFGTVYALNSFKKTTWESKMKKFTLLAIILMSVSSSVFACGSVSDISASEVSEPVITSDVQSAPVIVHDE